MRKTIYILISLFSFVGMIVVLNISYQQEESYYYTSEDTEEKEYFTPEQTEYIESFFIECTIIDDQVLSLQKDNQKPVFIYKNQRCWIYKDSSYEYVVRKENILYKTDEEKMKKLLSIFNNFSLKLLILYNAEQQRL